MPSAPALRRLWSGGGTRRCGTMDEVAPSPRAQYRKKVSHSSKREMRNVFTRPIAYACVILGTVVGCSDRGPTTITGSGTPTTCTAEYSGANGDLSATCDDSSRTCDCFTNGVKISSCTQASGGCYPEAGIAGVT